MNDHRTRVTLKGIARACGMDVSTVSRALSGDLRVKEETRTTIRELARTLGYRPNLAARHLVAGKTKTLLFIISSLGNENELKSCQAAAALLADQGYDLFTALYYGREGIIHRLLNRLGQGVADGAFIFPVGSEDPRRYREAFLDNRPLVFIDRNVEGAGAPWVTTDNDSAARELVRRCHLAGCRDFAIWFDHRNTVSEVRYNAVCDEIRRLGARVSGFVSGQPGAAAEEPATEPLRPDDAFAIIANDQSSALQTLAKCPAVFRERIRCFGVFDRWIGEPYPAQTAFVAVQDFPRIGEEATRLMLQMLETKTREHGDQIIRIPASEILTINRNF